jgi:hypothetical protein
MDHPPTECAEIPTDEQFIWLYLRRVLTPDQWIQIARKYQYICQHGGAGEIKLVMRPGKVPRIVTALSEELERRIDS